ncbi:NUDIX hydrolase [Virgibacillus siamensis]|uniref:NUDIX hydrolase n=1 Tax=Virgibacillus siamensis TaxID=480071 RepID=UPI00098563F8|nr:CoA pyrophosphatase [Virgibacillus siamensis]
MDLEAIQHKLEKHSPTVLGIEQFSKYAVLLPLIQRENGIHVLFEVRSHKMRRQPGEICFPGGRMDPVDKTDQDTAVRETSEELGIDAGQITNVAPLDFLITPFGMIIYPHAGQIHHPEAIQPNPSEVDEVFEVPLSFFLENPPKVHYVQARMEPEADFPVELLPGGEDYDWRPRKIEELFYVYGDKVIWGLTAKILTHFVGLIR